MCRVIVLSPSPHPAPPRFYAQFVREYPGDAKVRQDLQIATKFAPYPYRIGSQSIITACDETLERVEADVSVAPPPPIRTEDIYCKRPF